MIRRKSNRYPSLILSQSSARLDPKLDRVWRELSPLVESSSSLCPTFFLRLRLQDLCVPSEYLYHQDRYNSQLFHQLRHPSPSLLLRELPLLLRHSTRMRLERQQFPSSSQHS